MYCEMSHPFLHESIEGRCIFTPLCLIIVSFFSLYHLVSNIFEQTTCIPHLRTVLEAMQQHEANWRAGESSIREASERKTVEAMEQVRAHADELQAIRTCLQSWKGALGALARQQGFNKAALGEDDALFSAVESLLGAKDAQIKVCP